MSDDFVHIRVCQCGSVLVFVSMRNIMHCQMWTFQIVKEYWAKGVDDLVTKHVARVCFDHSSAHPLLTLCFETKNEFSGRQSNFCGWQ